MRASILCFFILLCGWTCSGQDVWQEDTFFDVEGASQVYLDHFNSIYIIHQSTIKKYNAKGLFLKEYNNPGLGYISYINVFNPLNILVYYEEYNAYVFLDNQLNPNLNSFQPSNHGFYDVQLAATLDQNSIWFYDQVNDKLYQWSLTENKVLNSTLQINQIALTEGRPQFIWSTIKNVYLSFPNSGIIVFDNFGAFERTIPIKNVEAFYLTDFDLVYTVEQQVNKFNILTKEEINTPIPVDKYDDLSINENRLIVLINNKVYIYFKA